MLPRRGASSIATDPLHRAPGRNESITVRIVVFTRDLNLTTTSWWPVLLEAPGLTEVLVCRQRVPHGPRHLLKSVRTNVRKHGLIFIPYRLSVLLRDTMRAAWRERGPAPTAAPAPVPVRWLEVPSIHAADVIEQVRLWQPDLGVSLGAPILKPALFQIPRLGTINLHLGAVPEFRGAPPAFWELYTGAAEIGATVHWVDETVDTGPVVAQARAPLYAQDTLHTAEARAVELGVAVLRRAFQQLTQGRPAVRQQPSGGQTFRFPTLRQRAELAGRLAIRRARLDARQARTWLKRLAAIGVLGIYRPVRDLARSIRGDHPIRIFTFHRVTNLCRDGMTVRPEVFRRQARYLARSHRIVSLEAALEMLRTGARPRRPIGVITFDDGYASVHDHAAPELRQVGVPATCFVCTELVGTDARLPHDADAPAREQLSLMGWRELDALRAEGWTIGAHSATHPRLAGCGPDALRHELDEPIRAIRARWGQDRVALAYPFGGTEDVPAGFDATARHAGYAACLSNFGGENPPARDPWRLQRIDLGGDHDTLAWQAAAHGLALSGIRTAIRRHPFLAGRRLHAT